MDISDADYYYYFFFDDKNEFFNPLCIFAFLIE